jgi:SAM-dependent methyltransferase
LSGKESPPRAAGRFKSPEDYRAYQIEIACGALAPILARLDVTLDGARLLDVGCGHGGMTRVWREMGADAVGVDRDASRLVGLSGEYLAADVLALPFAAGEFDLVFAHDILEHVRPVAGAVAEIARVLADGGRALVSFPPYYGPYGGHQQGLCGPGRFVPYGHLLPRAFWMSLAASRAYTEMFDGLARLSVSAFERIVEASPLRIERRLSYIVRPEVAVRARLMTIGLPSFADVPILREFVTGAVFFLLCKE